MGAVELVFELVFDAVWAPLVEETIGIIRAPELPHGNVLVE
jgi:hypothetical protein